MNDPTQAGWARIESLFHAAQERAAAERPAFLAEACGGDAALRREVEAMLSAGDTEDLVIDRGVGFAQPAVKSVAAKELEPGTMLGAWRVLHLLGRGGMGEVYLAARADGTFQQEAAVKVLRPEAAEHLARFQAERQILARLEHPGIARLLDAGSVADGRPYMLMEYVRGQTLLEFCAAHGLPLAGRLDLFEQVCDAVAYAHSHLVVHRDLKSNNILVTPDGRAKLLDFGVAKLLDTATWSATGGAETRNAPLTPDHAAPEQLLGRPVTTATDVYALGIVLYELLSGQSPWWSVRHLPLSMAIPRLLHEDPPPASVTAAQGEAPVAARLLAGDLDAIIGRAQRKEPAQRYPTVSALRGDLQRYRSGEPVTARPPSRAYRLGKFLRRYRIGVGVAAAVVVGAGAFTWRVVVERDRALSAESSARAAQAQATQEASAARQITEYLVSLFDAASPGQARGQAIAPRALVDRGRQQLEAQLTDHPQLRARMLATLGQLYSHLGLSADARATLDEALKLQRANPQADPLLTAQYLHDLGETLAGLFQHAEAEVLFREALALREAGLAPDAPHLVDTLLGLGDALGRQGKVSEGIAVLERAQGIIRHKQGESSVAYARCLQLLGLNYERAGRRDEGVAALERAIALLMDQRGDDAPETLQARGDLGMVLYELGQHEAAIDTLRAMLPAYTGIYGAESRQVTYYEAVLGESLAATGRVRAAAAVYQKLAGVERRVGGPDSAMLALLLGAYSETLEQFGAYEDGLRATAEAQAIFGRQQNPDALATYYVLLIQARLLARLGRCAETLQLLVSEVPVLVEGSQGKGYRGAREVLLGDCHRRQKNFDLAVTHLDRAEGVFHEVYKAGDPVFAMLDRRRAQVLAGRGEHARAAQLLRDVIARFQAVDRRPTHRLIDTQLELAHALLELGRRDEAAALVAAIAPLVEQESAPGAEPRRLLDQVRARLKS